MAVTSFSNVFVQSYINHFGSSCMAGWTTYGKLDKFCLLPIQSVGLSVTTFVGQNLGAGNMNRAKKGTTTALIIAIGTAIILMFPVLLFASTLTSLFTQDEEVLAFGVRFIRLMMPFYIAICFKSDLCQCTARCRKLHRANGHYDGKLYCFSSDLSVYHIKMF